MCTSSWFNTVVCIVLIALSGTATAQETRSDTAEMNMDAVYERPFLTQTGAPVALGGYLEVNSLYRGEDGVNEGLSFQARRLTMFMSASISKRIKFLSELELEEGGREINIEFAAVDVVFHPALNLRAGIVMNPIGAFNQNHDGPKWEFVERPDVAVNLLPATWSNPGFGLYGKVHRKQWTFGYEAYLTNGFDDRIIDNEENRTFLPAAKENIERFEESHNGHPLMTAKIGIRHRKVGEVGLSYMGGIYNTFEEDGLVLADRSRLDVLALDFNTTIGKTGTRIIGEAAWMRIDVPETYTQQYGNKQLGAFLDIVQPVYTGRILDWPAATINVACRVDYVDWNREQFRETGEDIGDKIWAVTPAVSLRPTPQTVLRLNYRYQWQTDLFNNPAALSAAWLFGISTYF
ncbi:MAG: hypothetical protein R3301_03775 [Saprospiraceae bacterium]|nr:hypothetical protein [Saprospiraceae bacterium]